MENEALNKKLDRALEKLLTLDAITLKRKRSSHYNFGIEKPFVEDRLNLRIKLNAESIVKCQVAFDSNDYDFPPDIIFHNLPPEVNVEIEDRTSLLPGKEWDLNREDCLYTWLEKILKLIKKPVIVEVPTEEIKPKKKWSIFDNDDDKGDIFQEDTTVNKKKGKGVDRLNCILEKEDNKHALMQLFGDDKDLEILDLVKEEKKKDNTSSKPMGSFRANMDDILKKEKEKEKDLTNEEDDIFVFPSSPPPRQSPVKTRKNKYNFDNGDFNPQPVKVRITERSRENKYDFDAINDDELDIELRPSKSSKVKETKIFDLCSITGKQKEWRKEFLTGWLSRYRNNIMTYDSKNFTHFTLYLSFPLNNKTELWSKYSQQKQANLDTFISENPKTGKINNAKPSAPIIVNFKMSPISSRKLKLKLISVMNTTKKESSDPETMDLDYNVDDEETIPNTIKDIMRILSEKVPLFHFQLKQEDYYA